MDWARFKSLTIYFIKLGTLRLITIVIWRDFNTVNIVNYSGGGDLLLLSESRKWIRRNNLGQQSYIYGLIR